MPKSPPNNDAIAFGERLRAMLEAASVKRHGSGAYLAKKYQVANVTANAWLNGEHKPEIKVARKIAADHGASFDELYFGPSNVARLKQPVTARVLTDEDVANVTAVPMSPRMVPLLTYAQAGTPLTDYIDDFAPGAADEYVQVDADIAKKLGPYAFALYVEGDSMIPTFVAGDKIIIDPNTAVRPGDFVVAKIAGKTRATLKKYRDRGFDEQGREQFDLVPLNEDHPTIRVNASSPGHIIGVVVQKITSFR